MMLYTFMISSWSFYNISPFAENLNDLDSSARIEKKAVSIENSHYLHSFLFLIPRTQPT